MFHEFEEMKEDAIKIHYFPSEFIGAIFNF